MLCDSCLSFRRCRTQEWHQETCKSYKPISDLDPLSLGELHKIFQKWFPTMDTTRIDTRAAVLLSNNYNDKTPLWVFEMARSGFLKTTLTDSLMNLPRIIPINQLTPRSLCSGKENNGKPVMDLGAKFANKNRIGIVGETASIKAMENGEKRELFSVLKGWHDGVIQRDTGSGVMKRYEDCNSTLFFNSTPDFQKDTIIHQEIGTCFLCDFFPTDTAEDEEDAKRAIKYRKIYKVIAAELQEAMTRFMSHVTIQDIAIDDTQRDYIIRLSNRLKYTRVSGSYDGQNELTIIPSPEHPARVAIQLSRLYECLMSLDKYYDQKRANKILLRIANGTGDQVIIAILEYLKLKYDPMKHSDHKFSVVDVSVFTGLGRSTVKKRLELLTGLGFLVKEPTKVGEEGRPGVVYYLVDDIPSEKSDIIFSL